MGEGLKRAFDAAKRTRLPGGITKAEVRALRHVEAGKVYRSFVGTQSNFRGPGRTAPRVWRKCADRGLIECQPKHASALRQWQQLTPAGAAALAAQEKVTP